MLLVEFYKGAPDLVRFQEPWDQEHTYLDKLKVRLTPRVPANASFCKDLREPHRNISTGSPRKSELSGLVQKHFSQR